MELTERPYHIERPAPTKPKETAGRKAFIDMLPADMTWKSLIKNGLCLGMLSPCVTGKCDVMCAYGRRYVEEKNKHAG